MRIPAPRVRVFRWSTQMRLKNRWEVQLYDGTDLDKDGIALARFDRESDAEDFARGIKDSLGL